MQKSAKETKLQTQKLVLIALLTALTAILSYLGGFIKIGGLASISLTLIPVVLGAALVGPLAGAWLGAVSGIVFFFTADAAFWFGLNIFGTVVTVLVKGILAGLVAGLTYKLIYRKNRYVAVGVSAVICPIVNTGIFLLGCKLFFMDAVNNLAAQNSMSVGAYIIVGFVGLNFIFELLANILLSPAVFRVVNIFSKD